MTSLVQQLYWRAPYGVKCLAASLNSRVLDRQRHGQDYARTVDEVRSRDSWSRGQFEEYQNQHLRELVVHAARHVPYYRRAFSERGVRPEEIRTADDLRHLPILEKDQARRHCEELVDERLDRIRLIVEHTSGTTGTPVRLYRDIPTNSAAYAYLDARWHGTASLRRRGNRSVSLGGHLVAAPWRVRPPFWVLNGRWSQLYMSSYHLSPDRMDSYVDAIRTYGPEYIEGYPSSVHALANHIVSRGLPPVRMQACFTTAETLFDHQRAAIAEAFQCRTYDQYGCGEMAVFAAECEQGRLHLSPEMGIVEVLDQADRPTKPGQVGTLVCTGLVNLVQPFIRYRLGDIGSLSEEACRCGRSLPILASIEGRVEAVLKTRDGRLIGRLDPVFKGVRGVGEAQIIQKDWNRFLVLMTCEREFRDATASLVRSNLRARVGPDNAVEVRFVDGIPRSAAGKFHAIVCEVDAKDEAE